MPCRQQASGSQNAPCRGSSVGRQEERLLLRHDHVVGEPSVAVNANRAEVLAEIDAAILAVRATSAGDVGIAGDAIAEAKAFDPFAYRLDNAGKLMAKRNRRVGRELALQDVPVGAADAAGFDPHQQVARAGHRLFDVMRRQAANCVKADRFHR